MVTHTNDKQQHEPKDTEDVCARMCEALNGVPLIDALSIVGEIMSSVLMQCPEHARPRVMQGWLLALSRAVKSESDSESEHNNGEEGA